MVIEHSIDIEKHAETIFPWIAKPEKAMQWQKNVKSGKIITKKPEIIGTTFNEEIEENGKRLKMQGVITEFKNNKEIGFHLESNIHNVDINYSIKENNEKSTVYAYIKIKWKFPMNIVCIFLGKKVREKITRQLEFEFLELKKLCEI
jgi:hypothetical protein